MEAAAFQASNTLKITISGIRGIVGDSLSPNLPLAFGRAFGNWVKGGKVVVGMDPRPSGLMMKHALLAGLMASGCKVIDIGITPTPTVQIMVKALKAAGGVVITASHNPIEWNGMKFVRSDGIFLNALQAEQFLDMYHGRQFRRMPWHRLGSVEENGEALAYHINQVVRSVNAKLIRARRFKVVVDTANGAGSEIAPRLLTALGCEVIPLHTQLGVPFERSPEPVPKNLGKLCKKVKQVKADVGFAQDADADRLAIVDEKGNPLGEDYTLVMVADYLLREQMKVKRRKNLAVVTNLSTTMALDDVASRYDAKVFRTKIGEVNVSEEMKARRAPIGGEGNGGVIYPPVGYGRDSLAGMALILEALASARKPVSVVAASLPRYEVVKKTVPLDSMPLEHVLTQVRQLFSGEEIDAADGVKVLFPEAWVHVRGSNTEPIIRVIAEAKTKRIAEQLVDQVIHRLS